jgi:hypothetical protein
MSLLNGGYFARRFRGAPRVVVRAGDYLPPANVVSTTATAPSTTAAVFVLPFWHDAPVSWDRAAVYLTTAQAGAACRIGAYDWNNGNPNGAALLSDFGELDLSAGSGAINQATIDWTNPLADWWMMIHLKDVATQAILRCYWNSWMRAMSMLSTDMNGSGSNSWRKTQAYATLPTTLYTSLAPWGGTTPLCFLRAA